MSLTPKQLGLLAVARKRLGLEEEDYRAILRANAGVESARDLDYVGFATVMARFTQLGFKSDWRERTFGSRPGMATPAQIDTIRAMWKSFSGSEDEGPLNTWLNRTCKVSALRFLDADGAHKAINGLRAMNARKRSHVDAKEPT